MRGGKELDGMKEGDWMLIAGGSSRRTRLIMTTVSFYKPHQKFEVAIPSLRVHLTLCHLGKTTLGYISNVY